MWATTWQIKVYIQVLNLVLGCVMQKANEVLRGGSVLNRNLHLPIICFSLLKLEGRFNVNFVEL